MRPSAARLRLRALPFLRSLCAKPNAVPQPPVFFGCAGGQKSAERPARPDRWPQVGSERLGFQNRRQAFLPAIQTFLRAEGF